MLKTLRGAALGCLLLVAGFSAAEAADPTRIASMLTTAAVATGDLRITYEKVAAKGTDIVFSNVKLTVGSDNTAAFPTLVISGATERPGGGFTATRMAFDGGTGSAPGIDSKWATALLEDVVIPSRAEIDAHAKIRPFRKLTLGNVSFAQSAKGVPITVASVAVDVSDVSDTAPSTIHVTATGATMPIGFITNPIGNAVIQRMGYTEFTATLTIDGTYDTAKNSIALNSMVIDAAQVGKLALTAKLSDTSLGGIADPELTTDARAAARLDSVTLRFDDAGFTGRMLDMQADLYGGTRDDVRDTLVYGALPLLLNYVENQAFRQQFMDAASAFLANPKSFTITATPPMPVPLGEALRTAMGSPLKLPDLLSPQVSANK